MPTFAGFTEVTIRLTNAADPGDEYNVVYGSVTPSGVDGDELADRHMAIFGSAWATELDTGITIAGATIRIGQTPPAEDEIWDSTSAPRPGERDGSSLPPNCALLVKKNTGMGGRRNRGRSFIPHCIGEGSVNEGGVIDPGRVATLQNAANIWFDQLAAGGTFLDPMNMYILHGPFYDYSTTPPTVTAPPPIPTPVSSLTVDPTIATQRRRLRR